MSCTLGPTSFRDYYNVKEENTVVLKEGLT